MEEMELATQEVADEDLAPVTEQEGQEPQPAEVETEAEKTATQARRERRQAQIKRLVEEKETEAAKARDLQARIERLERAQTSHVEPQEKDFTDYNEYAAAKGAWRYATSAAQREQSEVRQEAEAHQTKTQAIEVERIVALQSSFREQEESAREKYADIDVVLSVAKNPAIVSPALALLVLETDQPVDVAYHLGKNPELARQISAMPPQRAAYELGKIEARIAMPQPKLKSDAPVPIAPVRGTGTATRAVEDMDYSEYRKARASGKL
jgi:hypothetical protein